MSLIRRSRRAPSGWLTSPSSARTARTASPDSYGAAPGACRLLRRCSRNGSTTRRTLRRGAGCCGNPLLAALITECTVTMDWHASQLYSSVAAGDAGVRDRFRRAKRDAKLRFADWLRSSTGHVVDPGTIFDSQIKRIHEYKRQLLNVIHIVVLYNRLRRDPQIDIPPRTFFFAGKAAPAYRLAKLIVKLINNVALTVDRDPVAHDKLRGVPPGLQRQSRRAAHSGERRVGTDFDGRFRSQRNREHEIHDERRAHGRHRDGATIEMAEEAGVDNVFLFGLVGRAGGGTPRQLRSHVALRERSGDARGAGFDLLRALQPGRGGHLRADSRAAAGPGGLLHAPRRLALRRRPARAARLYADPEGWAEKAIRNVVPRAASRAIERSRSTRPGSEDGTVPGSLKLPHG